MKELSFFFLMLRNAKVKYVLSIGFSIIGYRQEILEALLSIATLFPREGHECSSPVTLNCAVRRSFEG
jgi:hypothetical protein